MQTHVNLEIPEAAWKATGDYPQTNQDVTARLTADVALTINGVAMRVEAFAVDEPNPTFPDEQHVIDTQLDGILTDLVGDLAFPLGTTTIRDREYILIVTPEGA